jgi:hypothetical protein
LIELRQPLDKKNYPADQTNTKQTGQSEFHKLWHATSSDEISTCATNARPITVTRRLMDV